MGARRAPVLQARHDQPRARRRRRLPLRPSPAPGSGARWGVTLGEVTLREARPDELDLVGRQTVEAYAEYEPDFPDGFWEPYRAELNDARGRAELGAVVVAELESEVVGSISFHPDHEESDTLYLKMMAVVPSARGRGVADAFMDEGFDRARRTGASVLKWNSVSIMGPALRFYERLGYQPEDEHVFGTGVSLYTYRVRLG